MRRARLGLLAGTILAAAAAGTCADASAASTVPATESAAPPSVRRIEAQSQSYRAVGVINADRMSIRLARIADNAPVSDVALDVSVRSITQAAVAQPDGSFQVRMPVLAAPGEAIIAMTVSGPRGAEKLTGKLAAPEKSGDAAAASGRLRQGLWWVLNFAVCIGFLLLIARRRKRAAATDVAATEDQKS